MKEIKNILVAVNFSDPDGELLEYASSLAIKFSSKVWIIHVAAPEPDFVGYGPGPQYIRDDRAGDLKREHRTLQSYAEQLKDKSIEAESLLVQGMTVEAILDEALKLNIDLFVTGEHHHNFLLRLFTGDTGAQIVRKSNIPVLVIPFK